MVSETSMHLITSKLDQNMILKKNKLDETTDQQIKSWMNLDFNDI